MHRHLVEPPSESQIVGPPSCPFGDSRIGRLIDVEGHEVFHAAYWIVVPKKVRGSKVRRDGKKQHEKQPQDQMESLVKKPEEASDAVRAFFALCHSPSP